MGVLDLFWTTLTFLIGCLVVPILLCSFFVVKIFRSAWLFALTIFYRNENLEFIQTATIRSLVDTQRNQGIFTFLVEVRGECQPELIRRALTNIIEKRDKFGKLLYPRLQQMLVSKWGCYAWKKTNNFQLGPQNFVIGNNMFRARPLADNKLQEYVSEIVAKYFLQNVSPWQIVVIPNVIGVDDTHYILVRIHHILLTEEKNLNISELLFLKNVQEQSLLSSATSYNESSFSGSKSPLSDLFETPTAIVNLYSKITENFSNLWNEFISTYDPLENPEILKSAPNVYTLSSILFITLVTVLREYRKDYYNISADPESKLKYLTSIIHRESNKRQISYGLLYRSMLASINPINVIKRAIITTWTITISCTIQLVLLFYHELCAVYACLFSEYCLYPNTFVGFVYNYAPLCYQSITEIISCAKVIFEAPKKIIDEIIISKFNGSSPSISLCGRKVVSWTEKIPIKLIQDISFNTKVSETEIVLSAISAAISDFFRKADIPVPKTLPVTARHINKNYIFAVDQSYNQRRNHIGGIVCLKLPLLTIDNNECLLRNLEQIHSNVTDVAKNQPFIYLLSKLQSKHDLLTKSIPTVTIKLILNYFSRIYTVTLTDMLPTGNDEHSRKTTVWGQEVSNIIYWKPPQANISLSICISSYMDNITLAIMSDGMLSPHHVALGDAFNHRLKHLAHLTGVLKEK